MVKEGLCEKVVEIRERRKSDKEITVVMVL